MPKIERFVDTLNTLGPLRVTRRKARRVSRNRTSMPCVTVKCGCCSHAVEICHETTPTGDKNQDTLEIGGVHGTVDQWRQVLLPLLGIKQQ